jgi:hypothetical protein
MAASNAFWMAALSSLAPSHFRAHTRDADCRAGRRDVKDEKNERDENQ